MNCQVAGHHQNAIEVLLRGYAGNTPPIPDSKGGLWCLAFLIEVTSSRLLLITNEGHYPSNGLDIIDNGYSGETGHSFRFKTATDRSEATLDGHYTSLWPE